MNESLNIVTLQREILEPAIHCAEYDYYHRSSCLIVLVYAIVISDLKQSL